MKVEAVKFMNIVKTMVNECEKFANSLERYNEFKDEFTESEWEKLMKEYSEEEISLMEELDERYDYHQQRICKMGL